MKVGIKRKISIIILSIICACLFVAIPFAFFTPREVKADCVVNGTIDTEYFLGESVSIPSATFDVDGAEISANKTLVLPDGTVMVPETVVLEQSGQYTIRYTAQKDGKTYFDEKTFKVYQSLYEVSKGGSAVYGAEEKLDGAQGLKVSLKDESVFRLNRKINLNDLKKDEAFIKLHINPSIKGYAELDRIFIKVIDAYDENNFFAIKIERFPSRLNADTVAGVFGHINDLATVYSDNIVCVPQQAAWSGWLSTMSFVGDDSVNSWASQSLSFYFNVDQQRVLGEDVNGVPMGVLDLSAFPEKWQGLTTGDVYVEIFGRNFRAAEANLFIDSIAGVDLQTNKLTDDIPPVVSIDYGKFSADNYPFGYVGDTYKVFEASAFDLNDGSVNVQKSVYYNYYSDNKAIVALNGNTFKPMRAGVYTIVYTAKDKFGNVQEEYVDIEVLDAALAPEFSYSVSGDYQNECLVGQYVSLPSVAFDGGVGYITEKLTIVKNDKTYEAEGKSFRPMEAGNYTICFTATDYVGRVCEFTYDLAVTVSDAPIFVNNPEKMFVGNYIVGYAHAMPNIQAVVVNADGSVVDVPVTITANNGKVESGYYTPTEAGTVIFTLTASLNGKTSEAAIERNVYSITNEYGIDMKSLFIASSNVAAEYSANGYAEYKVTGTGKIEYINTVITENVFIKLQTDTEYKQIDSLIVRLYNLTDRSKKMELKLKNFNGLAFASINGQDYQSVVNGDFSGLNAFEVRYVESSKTISVNGLSYYGGEAFNGIQSDYSALEVEVIGEQETSVYGLIVEKVGNQALKNDAVVDIGKPIISCFGEYGGLHELGSVYKTPKVFAKDMIDPSIKSFTVSITAPDGSVVTVDGEQILNAEVKEYSFELTMYGAYFFEYVAKDSSNRKETFSYAIIVPDLTAPVVGVSGSYAKTANVGSTVTIASFTATDNVDDEDKLKKTCFVYDPNGTFKIVNGSFTADKAGKYVVYCYVTDSFGNVGLGYYSIEVK